MDRQRGLDDSSKRDDIDPLWARRLLQNTLCANSTGRKAIP